jgi:outer membrane protein assembly factor BamA
VPQIIAPVVAGGREGGGGRRSRAIGRLALLVLPAALVLCFSLPVLATVENDLDPENTVSDLLPSRPSLRAEDGEPGARGLSFTLLPQVGFGPETGPKAGVKFEGRDLFGGSTFVDLNALIALQLQQRATLTIGNPRLGNLMAFGTLSWYRDPAMEFFGTGNNDVGPEALSNHDLRRGRAGLFFAYRVMPRVALTVSGFYRETDVKPGEDDDTPSTQRFAPGLPGIGGARSSHFGIALVWNSRDEVVRPTRGWELILKYLSADRALWNDDADFSKVILDASYILPLVWRRQVVAVHGNAEVMFGRDRDIPFFELSSLGGDDTMRGYFQGRFLGKGRMVVNAEYRLKLVDFNFRRLWDVEIDGVGFGDAGRVYEGSGDFVRHVFDHLRYSYGGGVRIGFSSGLVARIDVGFSPEESGLVYLAFGHTF